MTAAPLIKLDRREEFPPSSSKAYDDPTMALSTGTYPKSKSEEAVKDYNAIIPGSWDDANVQKACEIWSLTEEEVQRLRDLQRRLSDVNYWKNEPHHVLWFMKGPFGYAHAEKHFRRMVDWRRKHKIDDILDPNTYQPPQMILDNTPSAVLHGHDRDGDPIYLERGGAMDINYLMKYFTKDELLKYAIWLREVHFRGCWKDEYERRQGHPVKNITIIFDLQGMSAGHLNPKVLDLFKEVMIFTKNYYSAPIKRMLIIRAPTIFRVGWSIVKHVFPAAARKKMVFSGPDNYVELLNKYVDPQILPPYIYEGGQGRIADGMPIILGDAKHRLDEAQLRQRYHQSQKTLEDDEASTTVTSSFFSDRSSTCSAEDSVEVLSTISEHQHQGSSRLSVACTGKSLISGALDDSLRVSTV